MLDTRNVTDEFKDMPIEQIVAKLDGNGSTLEIAIENTLRDYNMGTIVRSANAFGVRRIHVIGRRQWNKRGAMATDKYVHIQYHESPEVFASAMQKKAIIAVDNIEGAKTLSSVTFPRDAVLLFGQEGPGISDELCQYASQTVAIEQFGSTRSINVGVAAGIVMYEYTRQQLLSPLS